MENQTHSTKRNNKSHRGGQKTHRILMPQSSIKFAIGEKKYKLSLEDKSRQRINEAYSKINYLEAKNNQDAQVLRQEYVEKLQEIDEIDGKKESELMAMRNELENEYTGKLDVVAAKSEEIAITEYKPFLDLLFGKQAGDEIFWMVNNNSIAVNKIIASVMLEFNQANDVEDYMVRQVNSVMKMKAKANEAN